MNFRRFFILSLIACHGFILSCKKEKFASIDLFGHAGNGLEITNSVYHDNSQEAIELALGLEGTNGVEIDVRMSSDGELWLLHEDLLDNETSATGCISEKTSLELSEIHYKTANKEKLVQLKQLPFSSYGSMTFLLDVRHYNGCISALIDQELFASKVAQIVQANPSNHFIVLTNYEDWIPLFFSHGLEVYFETTSIDNFNSLSNSTLSCQGFVFKNDNIDKKGVSKIQADNKKVLIFEVRSPKKIRESLKKGPNGIITDDLRSAIIEKY